MPRIHVTSAVRRALLCALILSVSNTAAMAEAQTPQPHITLPTSGPPGNRVLDYVNWLREEAPEWQGEVWIVQGRSYATRYNSRTVYEMSAAPGSMIRPADRIFLRIQTLSQLWWKLIAWLLLGAAALATWTARRYKRQVDGLNLRLHELESTRGH
jgi:hypothetical protein